jgi:hypothetical protein
MRLKAINKTHNKLLIFMLLVSILNFNFNVKVGGQTIIGNQLLELRLPMTALAHSRATSRAGLSNFWAFIFGSGQSSQVRLDSKRRLTLLRPALSLPVGCSVNLR